MKQSMSPEKRWVALTDAAKWHGISITPQDPVRMRAIKTTQKAVRKRQPEALSASGFQLCEGFFATENKRALPILPSVDLSKSGVCLVDYDEAMKWVWKTLPIVPDPMAIVMIHNDEDFTGGPSPELLTFPALDSRQRRVILRGAMWQLGESKVVISATKHELDLPATIVVAATIWKDEADPTLWEACARNLVKSVVGALELEDRSIILEVWGRSFRNSKQRVEPEHATSALFHFRVHRSQVNDLLCSSGKHAIYFTPKSDSKLSHDDWNMIWFKDQTEANIALSKTVRHAGLARTRDKWAIRVPAQHFAHVFQEVKPEDDVKASIIVKKLFKIQPVPAGTTNEHISDWTKKMNWPTRVLKKLGRDAYLLGAETDPPVEHAYLNSSLLMIKQVGNGKTLNQQVTPLVAGPRQPVHNKNHDKRGDKQDAMVDAWAAYRTKHGMPNGSSASGSHGATNQATPAPAQQIEAPIAAKFAAFEKRLTMMETETQRLNNGQGEIVQQVQKMGHQLNDVQRQMQDVHKQVQGGIEMAFAKSMQEQHKQLDIKFAQLVGMIQGATGKRQQPEAGDVFMESPAKKDLK